MGEVEKRGNGGGRRGWRDKAAGGTIPIGQKGADTCEVEDGALSVEIRGRYE
jgi:hypothetical protein